MGGDIDFITGTNWYTWNIATLEKIRNDNGNNTDNWMNNLGIFFSGWPYLLMALGSVSRLNIRGTAFSINSAMANPFIVFFIGSGIFFSVIVVTLVLQDYWMTVANNKPWRMYKWALALVIIGFIFAFLFGMTSLYEGNGGTTICIILYANFNLVVFFHRFAMCVMSQNNVMRSFVDTGFYIMDSAVGYTMFVIIALLSFLGLPGILQMKLLFNDSFSKMASYGKIAKAMREAKIGYNPAQQPLPSLVTRPPSGESVATRGFDVKTMVKSEHRYM
jgi:1,3-beta-glucan synthase